MSYTRARPLAALPCSLGELLVQSVPSESRPGPRYRSGRAIRVQARQASCQARLRCRQGQRGRGRTQARVSAQAGVRRAPARRGQESGAGRNQAFQRLGDRGEAQRPSHHRLHDDIAGAAPHHPAAKRAIPGIERQDLLVFLALGRVVEFDHHAEIVILGPSLHHDEVGEIERKTTHRQGGQQRRPVHPDFLTVRGCSPSSCASQTRDYRHHAPVKSSAILQVHQYIPELVK